MTGSRIKQIQSYISEDEVFFLTYGDRVCDVDIKAEVEFHQAHGKIGTILAVQPAGRFGALDIDGASITNFIEKPLGDGSFINSGWFIFNKGIFDYLDDNPNLVFEQAPLQNLVLLK